MSGRESTVTQFVFAQVASSTKWLVSAIVIGASVGGMVGYFKHEPPVKAGDLPRLLIEPSPAIVPIQPTPGLPSIADPNAGEQAPQVAEGQKLPGLGPKKPTTATWSRELLTTGSSLNTGHTQQQLGLCGGASVQTAAKTKDASCEPYVLAPSNLHAPIPQ